jgi:hypothetical protein
VRKLWLAADQLGGSRGKFIKLLLITGKPSVLAMVSARLRMSSWL